MTTSSDPDEIRAEIEQTRARLSDDVDRLGESAAPKNVARRQVDRAKEAAVSLKDSVTESVMGRADDAQGVLSDRVGSARDSLSGVPDSTRARTRGNPLAAGLIAFGAGLLVSSLIPSSQREQEAVGRLQEKAEPLKEQVSQAASGLAAGLKEPAQQAVESVKETASQAAENVRVEGSGAADDVRQQVRDSKDNVQNA